MWLLPEIGDPYPFAFLFTPLKPLERNVHFEHAQNGFLSKCFPSALGEPTLERGSRAAQVEMGQVKLTLGRALKDPVTRTAGDASLIIDFEVLPAREAPERGIQQPGSMVLCCYIPPVVSCLGSGIGWRVSYLFYLTMSRGPVYTYVYVYIYVCVF